MEKSEKGSKIESLKMLSKNDWYRRKSKSPGQIGDNDTFFTSLHRLFLNEWTPC